MPRLHGIEPHEVDVTLPLGERVGHSLVLGTTRVGKTRLAELFITQDIRRKNSAGEHEVVIVFDPKGDADLLKRMYVEAKRAGRERSEEHTSELQSLMRISYAVFCLKKKKEQSKTTNKYMRK